MYSSRLRIAFGLTTVQKEFVRSAAVSSAPLKLKEEAVHLKSWREIPGPSSLPLVGSLLHFLPGGMIYNFDSAKMTSELNKLYGPIVRLDPTIGTDGVIFLYDAESAAQILHGENKTPIRLEFKTLEYYRKEYQKQKTGKMVKITGLITDHGDIWKDFRSTINPVVLQPKTIKHYAAAIDQVAQDMIARMKTLRDERNMIRGRFDVEMDLWALESISVIALGIRLNCLDLELTEDSTVRKYIQCMHDLFKVAEHLDVTPNIWKYVSTPAYKSAMKLYEEQEKLLASFIKKATAEINANKKKSDDEKGVLEKLLEINEEYAHVMASDMLFAGGDSVANTMMATLYLLGTNPEKQQKLREEVMSKQDKRPYTKACVKESMRMMPAVPGNLRRTTKEYSILGYQIPKDINVLLAHHDMSMMEKYYPKPKEFIPERWLAEKGDPLYHGNAHSFANSPFGFGARSCIGRRVAELEVETFLGRIAENFTVEWFGPPPRIEHTSMNYIKGPYNFIFKDA